MRTAMTFVLWCVVLVGSVVGLGAAWSATHIQSESGFVELVGALGTDEELQQAAADATGAAFVTQVTMPSAVKPRVQSIVSEAVTRLTSADEFEDAWRATARRTHRELFDTSPTPTTVRVDVAPLLTAALDDITAGLPITLPTPDSLFVTVSDEDPTRAVEWSARSATIAVVSIGAAAVAALLGLVTARRRSTTVAAYGLALLLAAGFWWVAGDRGLPRLADRGTPEERALNELLADRIAQSIHEMAAVVAVAGAVLLVVGLISRLIRGGRRQDPSPA